MKTNENEQQTLACSRICLCANSLEKKSAMKVTVATSTQYAFVFFPIPLCSAIATSHFFVVLLLLLHIVSERLRMFESCISSNLFGLYWRSARSLSQFFAKMRIARLQQRQKSAKIPSESLLYLHASVHICTERN